MMGTTWAVEQNTTAWSVLRKGRITASKAADLLGLTGPSQLTREWNELLEGYVQPVDGPLKDNLALIGADHMLVPPIRPVSHNGLNHIASIRYGRELEPWAAAAYAAYVDGPVIGAGSTVAFPPAPYDDLLMASPDAFLQHDVLLEFKCPYTRERLIPKGETPSLRYWVQVQIQLAATSLERGQLVVFVPSVRTADGIESGCMHIWDIVRSDAFLAEALPMLCGGLMYGQAPSLAKDRLNNFRKRVLEYVRLSSSRRPRIVFDPEHFLFEGIQPAVEAPQTDDECDNDAN